MSHTSEHLSSLRQEITKLRNTNARYSENRTHSAVEKSGLDLRNGRLLEIKQELSNMLNHRNEVWWDKLRKRNRAA